MMYREQGLALVITLVAMLLMSAVGAGLVLATNADLLIAANAGAASEALYAADAAFERTLADLQTAPDFTAVLGGSVPSAFVDGAATGSRLLTDGSRLLLESVLSQASCHKLTPCSDGDMSMALPDRPWGSRNPRWRLYSYGFLDAGIQESTDLPVYIVSMIADDPTETDGDPLRDGARTGNSVNPGAGILLVRAEAFGRRGAHRVLQGAVLRRDLAAWAAWEALDPATRGPAPASVPMLQVLSWEEIR